MAADRAAVTRVFRFDSFSGNASTIPLDSVSNMQNYEKRHTVIEILMLNLQNSFIKILLVPITRGLHHQKHSQVYIIYYYSYYNYYMCLYLTMFLACKNI